MQLTSTFVLAALFALKATSVLALPVGSAAIIYNEARDVADFDNYFEARSYDDELEFEARDFNDDFELDAREFDDFEEFEARTFSPKAGVAAAKALSTGSRFQNKMSTEKSTMQKEEAAIKKQQDRLKAQQNQVKLQEKIHADRKLLRNDNAFGTGKSGRRTTIHTPTTPVHTGSRFQNKIKSEHGTMQREEAAIKKQEARLKAQQNHVKLQEQVHADRKLLRNDNAFGTAGSPAHRALTRAPAVHAPGSRFQNKISSEQSTMRHEEQAIKDQEARLKAQQNQVKLQEQVHADRKLLRASNAFN